MWMQSDFRRVVYLVHNEKVVGFLGNVRSHLQKFDSLSFWLFYYPCICPHEVITSVRHPYYQNWFEKSELEIFEVNYCETKQIQGKWILARVIGIFQESVNLSVDITDCNSCFVPRKVIGVHSASSEWNCAIKAANEVRSGLLNSPWSNEQINIGTYKISLWCGKSKIIWVRWQSRYLGKLERAKILRTRAAREISSRTSANELPYTPQPSKRSKVQTEAHPLKSKRKFKQQRQERLGQRPLYSMT